LTYPTLYKRDTKGNIREWRMEIDGARYRTIAGLQGGQHVASEWTVATPKNVGRSNETTGEQQAWLEVDAGYTYQLEREYFRTIAEVDTPRFFKPMLAHKYEGGLTYPVYSQPKLDGIRCLASATGLASREGKPITSCPHVAAALEPFFFEQPDAVLDGELYNHALKDDFNKIVSAVKKGGNTNAVQYHVYDFASSKLAFGQRVHQLKSVPYGDVIVQVPTQLIGGEHQLTTIYGDYLEDGYEGQMVRLDKPYEQKRSKTLLKRKEFLDEEFPLVAIAEGLGNWAGVAKKVICRLPDGREFGAGIRGTRDRAAELLHETYDSVTIRFFALTPDGVPRFPVATAFHNGARL
jgi:ATP-dependent DNA ligase